MDETTQEQSAPVKRGGSIARLLIIVIILAAVVAAGYFFVLKNGAVAVVNGERVSKALYNDYYNQLAASVTAQGQKIDTEEVKNAMKQQVIDNLVAETLLLQEAKKAGISAKTEEVDNVLAENKKQFADDAAYQEALKKQGMTDSLFRTILTRQNIIQQFLTSKIDLSKAEATSQEINTLYEQAKAANSSIPPLSEIRDQVSAEVVRQKQQTLVVEFVNQLKSASKIEVKI